MAYWGDKWTVGQKDGRMNKSLSMFYKTSSPFQDWDLGLETGILATRLGFEGGKNEEGGEGGGEGENSPICVKA